MTSTMKCDPPRALILVLGLVALACGGSEETFEGDSGAATDTASVTTPDSGGATAADPGAASADPGASTGADPGTTPSADEGGTEDEGPAVQLNDGRIVGEAVAGVDVFRGIPFAAPPVGDLRWKPPQQPDPWQGDLDATKAGNKCPQFNLFIGGAYEGKEDCLYLNLWVPNPRPATPMPVMVWIHGGAFVVGEGGNPTYDGSHLARTGGVIIVTFNYRLGTLGFMAHEALTAEAPDYVSSGNYGLEDQRAALRWVQENISQFGGDAGNVTIFGESAGANSVVMHLVSPPSAGLFHRAAVQSTAGAGESFPTLEEAETMGADVTEELECELETDVLACLRDKDARTVQAALTGGDAALFFGDGRSWLPNVDGVNLPEQPAELVAGGDVADVPVLLGTNGDEGTLFTFLGGPAVPTDDAEVRTWLSFLSSANVDAVLERYPLGDDSAAAIAEIVADAVFVCPTRRLARSLVESGNTVWRYSFERPFNAPLLPNLGSFHSAEIPFVFQTKFLGAGPEGEDLALSTAMGRYWTSFADSGDPNGEGVTWPPYLRDTDPYLLLDSTISAETGLKEEICDFWDGLGAIF